MKGIYWAHVSKSKIARGVFEGNLGNMSPARVSKIRPEDLPAILDLGSWKRELVQLVPICTMYQKTDGEDKNILGQNVGGGST